MSNIIIKKYNKISKSFKVNYLFLSLSTDNISYKKIKALLSELPKNINVVYVYPHPIVSLFSNEEQYNIYKLKKKENLYKLNSFKDEFNFLVFDPFLFLCPDNNCKIIDYNNFFTDGSHFKLNTSKYLSFYLKNFLNKN